MKKISLWLTFFLVVFIFTSCSTKIDVNSYIDKYESLNLTLYKNHSSTSVTTITPNSEKFRKLLDWNNRNKNGWKISFASYIPKASITQNSFRLLIVENGVVIGFTDKNQKSKQYSKTVGKDELSFLID